MFSVSITGARNVKLSVCIPWTGLRKSAKADLYLVCPREIEQGNDKSKLSQPLVNSQLLVNDFAADGDLHDALSGITHDLMCYEQMESS